ncbi:MAG: hypothetical protein NTZ46_12040 [Verrucomicrobia bacterium]|nr:hypothetical protein [Verrucomicrobiota bacterium]
MNTLTLTQVQAAVDSAYQAALAMPQRVATQSIGANATLRTDLYTGPCGSGFIVVATVDLAWRKLVIARQHGPEAGRDQPAPTRASLLKECQEARAKRYQDGASVFDLADAETKLASFDPAMQAEGAAQKAQVLALRMQIKTAIPKPE